MVLVSYSVITCVQAGGTMLKGIHTFLKRAVEIITPFVMICMRIMRVS
jgi:hypothetical protein